MDLGSGSGTKKADKHWRWSGDEKWKDPRTGTILAPGAVQNWPSPSDEAFIKRIYKEWVAAALIEEVPEEHSTSSKHQKGRRIH